MEYRPSRPNSQFNQQHIFQTPQQLDFETFSDSQFSSQYVYNPQHPAGSFNSNSFGHQSQFSSYEASQDINLQNATILNMKKTQSQSKERSRNWAKDEDDALCNAWLQTSEDPITGSDQPRVRLWDRVLPEFHRVLGRDTERSSSALMNRWSTLQSHLNKYSGFVQMVKRKPTSGFNAEDSIGAVDKLYYADQGHHFKWYSCWLILKDTPKWFSYTKEQDDKKQKMLRRKRSGLNCDVDEIEDSSNLSTPANHVSINLEDIDIPANQPPNVLERPPGRKATKNARKNKNADHTKAINLFAEEFGYFMKDQKEISEKEINMTNERERMKIEAKKDLERMKIEAKQEQERKEFEKQIMMMDPSSVPTEEGKAWIIAQQKTILRHAIVGGHAHDASVV